MPTPQGGDVDLGFFPIPTASAVDKGTPVGLVAATGNVYKPSEEVWNVDLATTRAAFVLAFLGVASQNKRATEDIPVNAGPFAGKIRVANGGRVPMACKAGTYVDGVTLVGPAKQAGNLLEDLICEVVTTQAQAYGICFSGGGVNPGTITVMFLSSRLPRSRQTPP
jgi:hypothetical protein